MEELRLNLKRTKDIRNPHQYVRAIHGDYADWVFDEEDAPKHKGRWQRDVFDSDKPLDFEIGTGNGFFFAQRSLEYPDRLLLGIELKYKPLIQAIRRARRNNSENMRMMRFDGRFSDLLFDAGELNNVFIHHPDPWHGGSNQNRRMMNAFFLKKIYELQKPGSVLEFKTDSKEYFLWAEKEIAKTDYKVDRHTMDLHNSQWHRPEEVSHFQRLFNAKQIPINYLTLIRS